MNPEMSEVHPLVGRQLKRSGITQDGVAVDAGAWQAFLERVGQTYATADQERYLLERSLTISSREMQDLYASLREERDKLRTILSSQEVFSTLAMDEVLGRVLRSARDVLAYD